MRLLWLAAALTGLTACGYHVSGHADLVPKNIKTIAVPAFGNVTTHYDLSRLLPEDIAREFLSRTRYTVVSDPSKADAVLTGSVIRFAAFPTTIDNVTSRATAVQAVVTLQLRLVDRATGKEIFNRPNAEFRQRYQISENPQQYFDESGTAMIRLSRDVARSVVSAVLEKF
jgi:outer membrane lipopolysaccharide assembly protein LptE/RlpB